MSISPQLLQNLSNLPPGCKPSDTDPEPDGAMPNGNDYANAAMDLTDHKSLIRLGEQDCPESEWMELVRQYRKDLQELAEKYADKRAAHYEG